VIADGTVYCWGSNEYSQLGSTAASTLCDNGQTRCSSTPIAAAGGAKFKNVAASLRHSCAVTANSDAWCWGFGDGGQLGDGLNLSSSAPVQVAGAITFNSIALGGSGLVSCGIDQAGSGFCWGPAGSGGGLGNGTTDGSSTPVAISGGLVFTMLTAGDDHACGITANGAAYCWGHNSYGKLGLGAAGASSVPSPVAGGLAFTVLSAGLSHTCGLIADGSAYCWGSPPLVGSVASGSSVLAPIPVAGGGHFTTLSAGGTHTCALDAAGVAWCWGQNLDGGLGDNTLMDRVEPVQVSTSTRFVAIRAGGSSCALDTAGQAYCWGSNLFGQAGQAL
jgi:alpha-tubulin suppressor-like RCC1 family protein